MVSAHAKIIGQKREKEWPATVDWVGGCASVGVYEGREIRE